jgi:hypothetical protein
VSRPAVEVADIVRAQGDRFRAQHPWLSVAQRRALRAIERCRTAALGEHRDRCTVCGYRPVSFNSCRNRHCNKCQAQARERWLQARARELLVVSYIHVVFTLPHALLPLGYRNAGLLYTLLFRASAATLLTVAADPRHLGARIGFLSILHTWGQTLVRHPHVHCVVPAGGFSADRRRWVRPKCLFGFLSTAPPWERGCARGARERAPPSGAESATPNCFLACAFCGIEIIFVAGCDWHEPACV